MNMELDELLVIVGITFILFGIAIAFFRPVLTGAAIGTVSLGTGSLSSFTAGVLSLLAASLKMEKSESLEQILQKKAKRDKILNKMREASTAEAVGSSLKVFFKGKQVGNKKAEKILGFFREDIIRKIEREEDLEQLKKTKNILKKALKLSERIEVNRENKEVLRSFYNVTNQKLLRAFYG